MGHLVWHKPRFSTLGPKIEELADNHPSKPRCLYQLSRLFGSVGNYTECKRLFTYTLKLQRKRGDDRQVARTLRQLAFANWAMGLHKEGAQQAKEGSEISERLGDVVEQARCLIVLARLLRSDEQPDAASRAINLLSKRDQQFEVCECHQVLGEICRSKGKTEEAINHFEAALGIASSFNWHYLLFSVHHSLATLFFDEDRFDDAQAHVERAKSHTVNDPHPLARAVELEAWLWFKQHRLEEAKSEALRAVDMFEKLGATVDMEYARGLLRLIAEETGELLESVPLAVSMGSPCPDRITESE